MTARPLTAHLLDFSAPRRVASVPIPSPLCNEAEIAAARAAGFREGFAEGGAQAQAEFEQRCEAMNASEQDRLRDARTEWTESTAMVLSERIDKTVRDAQDEIATTVAHVLTEIAILARKSFLVEDMAARLLPILRDNAVQRLEIAGPADLVDALCGRIDGHAITRRDTTEGADVRIRIDGTTLETRLEAWRDTLLQGLGVTR